VARRRVARPAGPHACPRLDTFGDLAALSTAELLHTIGREGPVLARLAAGDDHRRVAGAARPRRLCRTVAFDRLVADATAPMAALEAQIETLTQRARQFGCGARSVSVRVEYEDASTAQHTTALRAPTTDPAPLVVALRAIAARLQLDTRPWRCATVSIGALTAISQAQFWNRHGQTSDRRSAGPSPAPGGALRAPARRRPRARPSR
jgi:hypothetical protein